MKNKLIWTLNATIILSLFFVIAIPLTTNLTYTAKGILHGGVSFLYLLWIFSLWSTFKHASTKQFFASLVWLLIFYLILQMAINLVAALPTIPKAIMHFLVVFIFFSIFLYIWRKPETNT